LLTRFVHSTPDVRSAIVVSSDGLLVAMSGDADRDVSDRFAAITSGVISLALGTAQCFEFEAMNQVIVEMRGGWVFIMSINDGSCLAVVCERTCDIGLIGYEMTLLAERAGGVLTPELVSRLRTSLRH
jgi:predicted regulator of Ras-like GTPase activity (Roadblock/LC7/MglB family)